LELDRFEQEILSNPHATERNASAFFYRFPKFLFLGEGAELRREVVLMDTNGRNSYRVDFFRRSFGSVYWDIVELKHPQKQLVIDSDGHPRVSAAVEKAMAQAQTYRDRILEDAALRDELLRKGIHVYRPQILVIAGRSNRPVPPETMQILYDRARKQQIQIRSYDDLYQFAKEHYHANQVIVLLGQFGTSRSVLSRDLLVLPELVTTAIKLLMEGAANIDELLGVVVRGLECHADRRVQMRTVVGYLQGCGLGGAELIKLADRQRWPGWAVECLPDLCVSLQVAPGQPERMLLWKPLVECLPVGLAETVTAQYCEGRVIEVTLPSQTRPLLHRIASVLESARKANPFPSERSTLACLTHAVTSLVDATTPAEEKPVLLQYRNRLLRSLGANVGK
jgi:hypothetical protein